jgi:hypothetical protein
MVEAELDDEDDDAAHEALAPVAPQSIDDRAPLSRAVDEDGVTQYAKPMFN